MRLAKGTDTALGVAVILTGVLGVGTAALAANGKPFILGKGNVATAVSTFVKQGPGPALRLLVRPGQPPMAVNSQVKVANLNADKIDGKDSAAFFSGRFYETEGTRTVSAGSAILAVQGCDTGDTFVAGGFDHLGAGGIVDVFKSTRETGSSR